jgi:hypothetical protein
MISTDPSPSRTVSTSAALLLGFTFLVYTVMMMMLYGSGPADGRFDPNTSRIVDAIGEVFEMVGLFSTLLLWILLAILLFGGGIRGPMRIVAAVLLPLSGVAAIFAGVLYSHYAGWSIVVPVLLPPLIALYAIGRALPAPHAALPAKIINAAAGGRDRDPDDCAGPVVRHRCADLCSAPDGATGTGIAGANRAREGESPRACYRPVSSADPGYRA